MVSEVSEKPWCVRDQKKREEGKVRKKRRKMWKEKKGWNVFMLSVISGKHVRFSAVYGVWYEIYNCVEGKLDCAVKYSCSGIWICFSIRNPAQGPWYSPFFTHFAHHISTNHIHVRHLQLLANFNQPQPTFFGCFPPTWMSQEVSKWLVNGL